LSYSEHDSLFNFLKSKKINIQTIFDIGSNYGLFTLGASIAFRGAFIYVLNLIKIYLNSVKKIVNIFIIVLT